MRHVLVPNREELGEGGWIIAAAGTVINSDSVEKRLNNVTAQKTREVPCFEAELFEASKIL
jgi:hypothetical protein